ncbi:conserved hypothetical protein [Hymenobacter roseosalivarius DSM 11622]|uniref:Imm33-like domain-containing protein n=1 Tax=Hymenobacter roseosalivarius DSM 11622 TaxID=645990 RepID=A0A1W1UFD3_9BACT|nr:hypothetical protein [Hymenobacter roseosalivarius]SMB79796.1 conserved hypothetical protein [Hymenobacter roseosalivarius DSM 11622]
MNTVTAQIALCQQYGAAYVPSNEQLKVGLSRSVAEGVRPIHGVRYAPEADTTGWYIWAGEFSLADDFFQPVHLAHLTAWAPQVQPYLGLGPGWRFILDPEEDYVDVWFDDSLGVLT